MSPQLRPDPPAPGRLPADPAALSAPSEPGGARWTSMLLPYAGPSVGEARSRFAADLAGRGVPPAAVDDAVLVLSELLGNALRHAKPLPPDWVRLSWGVDPGGVQIQVADGGGPGLPVAQPLSATSVGGRGLAIVSALCTAWGVRPGSDGNTVWAIVPGLAGDSAA